VRPEGSLVIYHFNPNNYSNFNKSIYNLIIETERDLLEAQAHIISKKYSAKEDKDNKIVKFLNPSVEEISF
jgi:uncharacterized protein YecA (UPF0149 family)